MAKNYVQDGKVLTFTAAAALSAGAGVLLGALFGVVQGDVASGADGEMMVAGVHTLTKSTAAGSATTLGGKVYWDDTNEVVTGDATGNTLIGVALAATADGDASVDVRLNGAVS
jgi:predicted RecA/RadA family phage recombinase